MTFPTTDDGSTPIVLPKVYSAPLDAATLERLFADIAGLGTHVDVRLKLAPAARASTTTATLPQAYTALLDGTALGVQVRYRHDGSLWFDTLIVTEAGLELRRIAHPIAAADREAQT